MTQGGIPWTARLGGGAGDGFFQDGEELEAGPGDRPRDIAASMQAIAR